MAQQPATGTGILKANAVLVTIFTVLMVATAALAGNGIFKKGTMEWLVTGHQHTGNLLFFMGVIQLVLAYLTFSRKQITMAAMGTSFLLMVLTFAQIGLGYSTRNNMADIVGWHIALGVGITAVSTLLAMQLWQAAARRNVA